MQQKEANKKKYFVITTKNVMNPTFYSNPYTYHTKYPSLSRKAERPEPEIKTQFNFFGKSERIQARKFNTTGMGSPREDLEEPLQIKTEPDRMEEIPRHRRMNMTFTSFQGIQNDRHRQLSLHVDRHIPFKRPIYQPDNIEESPSKLDSKQSFSEYMKKRSYYDSNIDNSINLMQKIVASKQREAQFRTTFMEQTQFLKKTQPLESYVSETVDVPEFHRKRYQYQSIDFKLDTLKKYTPITTFQKNLKDSRISNKCKIQIFRPNLNS